MKELISVTAVFLIYINGIGQNVEFEKANFSNNKNGLKEAKRNIEQGDGYYQIEMYNKALPLYLKADTFNSKNALLNYKIGVCYIYSPNKQKATSYMEMAYQLNHDVAMDIHYYLGRTYHLNMEWDKAIKEYHA